MSEERNFTTAQEALIRQMYGIDGSDFELFLYTCKRTGLDPLARQIYAIKRKNQKTGEVRMTIQTGIDGYRVIADRTSKLAGISDYVFDSEDKSFPAKATVTVKKAVAGLVGEFTATARWGEYNAGGPMWSKMPYLMLGKCAEALALRKAFPADLSGVYTTEEMAQADNPERDQVFSEVERQKASSNVGRNNSVLDAEPTTGDIQKPSEAKATLTMVGRTGTANVPTETIPPELDFEYVPASGLLICRIESATLKTTKGGKEYLFVNIYKTINGLSGIYYWHNTHRNELLAAKGKVVKMMVTEKPKGITVDLVLEIDGKKLVEPEPDWEFQAQTVASLLNWDNEQLRELHARCKADWKKVLEELKQEKARREA